MPIIREYTAPDSVIRPDETGPLALARAGHTIRADYNEAGAQIHKAANDIGNQLKEFGKEVEKHDENQELTEGASLFATLHSNLTNQWNDASKNADPHDPNVANAFRQNVSSPALQQFTGAFKTPAGKRWAAERAAALDLHLGDKSAADMSTLAAIAVRHDVQNYLDQSSNTVAMDPTSHDFVKSQIGPTVQAMVDSSPNLSAADKARAQGELSDHINKKVDEAAFSSIALKNPQLAEQMVKANKFPSVNGVEAVTFIRTAEHNQKMEASAARVEARLAAQERSERLAGDFLNKVGEAIQNNGQGLQGLSTDILHMAGKGLKPEMATHLFSFIEAEHARLTRGEQVTTDPATANEFRSRLTLDPTDPNALSFEDLVKASNDRKLSNADFSHDVALLKMMRSDPDTRAEQKQLTEQLKSYQGLVTTSNPLQGAKDVMGDIRWSQAQRERTQAYWEQRKAGVSKADLLDPSSPRFWLKGVEAYAPTFQQSLQGVTQSVVTGKQPLSPAVLIKPGESVEDFVKRLSAGPAPAPKLEPKKGAGQIGPDMMTGGQ